MSPGHVVSFLRFTLTLESWGAVTTPAPLVAGEVDLLVDTSADGRPQIPGTSLAGVLQQRLFDRGLLVEDRETIFGTVRPDTTEGDAETVRAASRLWVFDAVADLPVTAIRRQSTAIDRHTAAPRSRTLRTVQVLPAGTRFKAYLRWDGELSDRLCGDLLDALSRWRVRMGHAVSSGRGVCSVSNVFTGSLNIANPDDLLTWLKHSGPDLVRNVATIPHAVEPASPGDLIRIGWVVDGPLLVVADQPGSGSAARKELTMGRRNGDPVIPGSSIKGLVRSRMEYVLRSAGVDCCGHDPHAQEPRACGVCLPCAFFGFGGSGQGITMGQRGRVMTSDAIIRGSVPSVRTRSAIDRFTGGNAQRTAPVTAAAAGQRRGMLFTLVGVEGGEFTMEFDIGHLRGETQRRAFECLLRLVVDDLNDGLIGIGHSTRSGYGSIRLADDQSLPSRQDALTWLRRQPRATGATE